jgi:Ca2+-binding RTX toxin-like protein
MLRLALAAASACLLLVPATASADFASCTYGAGTVTATLDGITEDWSTDEGGLRVGAGGAIEADGRPCGAATRFNTDAIVIDGSPAYEHATLDLGGGAFAPGATNEPGDSDEIEITADLDGGYLIVHGTPGADAITVGHRASDDGPAYTTQLNLNAAETTGVDVDVTMAEPVLEVHGGAGGDTITDGGGAGAGLPHDYVHLLGGAGNDDIAVGGLGAHPGPGDDTIRLESAQAYVHYDEAGGPVTVRLPGGTDPGLDGDGGTDTYVGVPHTVYGSPHGDTMVGTDANDRFSGLDGGDHLAGGDGDDELDGDAGSDEVDGDDGADFLKGEGGDDTLDGGPGDDWLDGENGDDHLVGGDGDDGFDQRYADITWIPGGGSRAGADVVEGGEGFDHATYDASGGGRSQGLHLSLDGVANDGYAGEGDNVLADVEGLTGGGGRDVLIGSGRDDTLSGGDDNDAIDGRGGSDVLYGDAGDDTIRALDEALDELACGDGADLFAADAADLVGADCETREQQEQQPPPDGQSTGGSSGSEGSAPTGGAGAPGQTPQDPPPGPAGGPAPTTGGSSSTCDPASARVARFRDGSGSGWRCAWRSGDPRRAVTRGTYGLRAGSRARARRRALRRAQARRSPPARRAARAS